MLVYRPLSVGLSILRGRNTLSMYAGVPQGATQNTVVATYNDLANVEELIKGGDVAAVILEPVVGNSGFIRPTEVGRRHSHAFCGMNVIRGHARGEESSESALEHLCDCTGLSACAVVEV